MSNIKGKKNEFAAFKGLSNRQLLSKTSAGTLIATDGPSNPSMQIQAIIFFNDYVNKSQGGNKGFSHVIMMNRCIFRVDLKEKINFSSQSQGNGKLQFHYGCACLVVK